MGRKSKKKKKPAFIRESVGSLKREDNHQPDRCCTDSWVPPQWIKVIIGHIDQGRIEEASALINEAQVEGAVAATSMPEKGVLMVVLARALRRLSMVDRAETLLKQLLVMSPGNVPVINEIANALQEQGKINEATKYLTQAMEISPNEPEVWGNLGINLVRLGHTEKGISLLTDAVDKMPHNNPGWSLLLQFMHYSQDMNRADFLEMSRKWACLNVPSSLANKDHDLVLDPNRKLRIGYISPDFRDHSVTFFFEPLLDAHNRDVVTLCGYGNVAHPDHITERLKTKFDIYKPIYGLDSKAIAEMISGDCIDILVDLAGHSGGTGIYAMAHKPAPIQVTWLGYPDTTGLKQIDYRFTDLIADPPGSEKFYTEKLVYLPECFLCYGPGDVVPPVATLPCKDRGYVVFGCFNNSAKLNDSTIELWSKILKATPNSKLLLKFKSGENDEVKALFTNRFKKYGVSEDRLITSGWLRPPAHLELYHQVDIALDTFPYNGTATTCQSLLMGVPVISLAGEHHMSRVGLSLLKNVGLEFFVASTPQEYVSKAVALAGQTESLSKIRSTMRNRIASSSLCNNYGFARKIEQAYRTMWRRYCQQRGVASENTSAVESPKEEPKPVVEPSVPKTKAKRGIMYIVWGQNQDIEKTLARSIKSAEHFHPELPIHVDRLETGSKVTKTTMLEKTPFEETLFLDVDTVVLGRLDYGFAKASQFGLACCINENPWARRFGDSQLSGDMVEYNSGVLFFTEKARPVFDAWHGIFPEVDGSLLHYQDKELCRMPATDQASFALAIEQTGFLPFVLPKNWNFRPQWYKSWFGPIKVWHDDMDVPESLLTWNEQQFDKKAIIQFAQTDG